MKLLKDKNCIYILGLTLLMFVSFILMYGKWGSIIIDTGREVYFSEQVALGKILYKDIVNIYGPFSYMFNGLMFKLFGINLNVLYLLGGLCAYGIVLSIYSLGKQFISKELGLALGVLTIAVGMYSSNVFNIVFPYSYAMLYGTLSVLLSLVFLFRNNRYDAIISGIFAGVAVFNKYDFILYLPVFIFAYIKLYKPSIKQFLYIIFSVLSVPLICSIILVIQGLRFDDVLRSFKIVKYLSQTNSLHYFYSHAGLIFRKEHLLVFGKEILNMSIYLWLFSSVLNSRKMFVRGLSLVLMLIYMRLTISCFCFSFIPVSTLVLFFFMYKKISFKEKILVIATWSITWKTFLGLSLLGYSVFYIGLVLLSFMLLITKKYLKESVIFILILSLFWGYISYKDVQRGYKLQTNKGFIYTESAFGKTVDGVLDYIRLNTNLNDRILIYPEGQLINFLSDRKSDTLVYSLIPLYVELFSEKNIIHRLEIIQPEYILINNWNTGDYYYKELCVDYGLKIADYIKLNYHKEVVYGDLFKMTIYKRNDL